MFSLNDLEEAFSSPRLFIPTFTAGYLSSSSLGYFHLDKKVDVGCVRYVVCELEDSFRFDYGLPFT